MTDFTPPIPPIVPGSVLSISPTVSPTVSPTDVPSISVQPISTVPSTPVTPTPSATPSPFLSFAALPSLTACSGTTIIWDASGDISNLTIVVSDHTINSPLPGASLLPRQSASGVQHVVQTIATGLNPTSNVYFWDPIAVPQGSYVLVGTVNGLDSTSYSPQFTVSNGSDTSCLTAAVPASAASTPKSRKAGAIAGGVIGGLALAAILIAIFLFWRAYRASRRGRRGPNGHGTIRNWNGLSSRDSGFHGTLPSYNKSYQGRGQTESTGKILSANNSTIGHGSSPVGSAEDVSTLATDVEKPGKFFSRGSFDYIDTIPPLSYNPRRRSSITISTTPSPTTTSPISPNGNSPTRTRSTSSQHRNSTLAKLEANAPVDALARSPSYSRHQQRQSLDGRLLSNPMDMPAHVAATSPGLMAAELTPIGRSASGGARRANRKPVPTYDASALEDSSPIVSTSPSSFTSSPLDRSNSTGSTRNKYPPSTPTSVITPAAVVAPQMYSVPKANNSGSGSSANGVFGTPIGGRSIEDIRLAGGLELPSLNHKSSFGDGRPVHYLIPDLPPPQRD